MTNTSPRYADWKAPAADGQILIWPRADALPDLARRNAEHFNESSGLLIQNVPLPQLRLEARAVISQPLDAALIATGHQVELYHPGVWVKDVLAHTLAAKLQGKAYHFAVDTDAPKHLHLRWPGGSEPLTDDPRITTAAYANVLQGPTPAHLRHIMHRFSEAATQWNFTPSIGSFVEAMRIAAVGERRLAMDLTGALHATDWDMGLRYDSLVVSPLWSSLPYLTLAHHLLARPGEFAGEYNGVLREYRRAHGIRTAARPMPNLWGISGEVETPFWLDDLSKEARARLTVRSDGGNAYLTSPGGEQFSFNPNLDGHAAAAELQGFCRRNHLSITPRAITLTMYFRMLLADLFIHGIGGGRYDQVTDEVVGRFFGFQLPPFAVTTATMYFPTVARRQRIDLSPLLQEGRRIRHGALDLDKRSMVARIEALPRGSSRRQDLFLHMHARLAADSNSPAARDWEQRLLDAERKSLAERALFDRELFFAIQPRDRLAGMIQRYAESVVSS